MTAGLALFAALALAGSDAGTQGTASPRFSLRLQGGIFVPTGIQTSTGGEPDRSLVDDMGFGANAALGLQLHPNVALELGTGRIHVRGTELNLPTVPGDWVDFDLTSVPLTLGLRVGSGSPGAGFWAAAGAGVWFSRVREQNGYDDWSYSSFLFDEVERDTAFGAYAGVGWGLGIGPGTYVGLEARYVRVWSSFERLAYSGDGVQIQAALTHRFGGSGPAESRGLPESRDQVASDELPAAEESRSALAPDASRVPAEPPPAAAAKRGKVLAVGGVLQDGAPSGELGVAGHFTPRTTGEFTVGVIRSEEGEDSILTVPLTLSARWSVPVGGHIEASAYGGAGVYVVNWKEFGARYYETRIAPGLHAGGGLAIRILGEGSIGLDARLLATRARFEPYRDGYVTVAGIRIGLALGVPF